MNYFKIGMISILSTIALTIAFYSINSNANNDETVINLNKNNVVVLDDEVNPLTVARVQARVQELDNIPTSAPIFLILETPGGDIQAGLEMISALQAARRPIHTVTFFSASMGFQIVQGLGTRYILKHGTLMAHKARGGFSGEFPGQLDSRYQYYLKRINEMDNVTVKRSNGFFKSITEFQAKYENEWWIDGFEAVKVGMADKVINVKCDKTLNGTHDQVVNFFGAAIQVTFSDCPAIRGPISFKILDNKNNIPEQLINTKIDELKNRQKILRSMVK